MGLSHHKLPAHKVDSLNGSFNECFFSEKVNQPKASAFGLDSGHVFHDFLLCISEIHINVTQTHVRLQMRFQESL